MLLYQAMQHILSKNLKQHPEKQKAHARALGLPQESKPDPLLLGLKHHRPTKGPGFSVPLYLLRVPTTGPTSMFEEMDAS